MSFTENLGKSGKSSNNLTVLGNFCWGFWKILSLILLSFHENVQKKASGEGEGREFIPVFIVLATRMPIEDNGAHMITNWLCHLLWKVDVLSVCTNNGTYVGLQMRKQTTFWWMTSTALNDEKSICAFMLHVGLGLGRSMVVAEYIHMNYAS